MELVIRAHITDGAGKSTCGTANNRTVTSQRSSIARPNRAGTAMSSNFWLRGLRDFRLATQPTIAHETAISAMMIMTFVMLPPFLALHPCVD